MGCLISVVKYFLMFVGIITLILVIGIAVIYIDRQYVAPDNTTDNTSTMNIINGEYNEVK